jgi:integrase
MGKARRARGEGTVYELADGRWTGQITVGYDPVTGKQQRRTVYGQTQKEVQGKLLDLRNQAKAGTLDTTDMGLKEALSFWLSSARHNLAVSTYERYQNYVNLHLVPRLGAVKLARLSAFHVAELYRRLEEDGISVPSQRNVGKALRQALAACVKMGLIHTNPATKVPLPRPTKKEFRPLTRDQCHDLLRAARARKKDRGRCYPLFVIALETGARQGELLALQWPDIDLGAGELIINKSVRELKKGGFQVKETKTRGSRRRIKLSPWAVEALRGHEERMRGEKHYKGCPVFCDGLGGYQRRRSITKNTLRPVLKAAGLPQIRFHDLRHTCATLALMAGVPVKVVSERLGHASITITLEIYAHVLPTMQEAAALTIAGLLQPPVAADKQLGEVNGREEGE